MDISGQVVRSYQLLERIGAGGFGAVFRAIQPSVDREVAIKVILSEFANRPEFIRRFDTEAQLVARLEHPHIVPLYDYWREPNSAYLVMRYLRGGSLSDSFEEHGHWSAPRTLQMVNQVGAALAFAHQNGVIHRDLKSDNILLDEAGNCYLGDFGIAKDLWGGQQLTKDALMGTPAYLSPEQIRGEEATVQTDIYAFGILTYEALTGRKPFSDVTPATILFKQLNDPIPNIVEARPELPLELDFVLQRATAKDPAQRYETALAFARDFQQIIREALPGIPATTHSMTIDVRSITEAENELIEPKNPYKGLRAFQQADNEDFYGRDELVDRLLARLNEDDEGVNFLAVVGPSGSGKSSVVKAGVLPKIKSGALDENSDWFVLEMVPGTHPFEELEAELLGIAPKEMPGLLNQLQEDDRGLVRAVKRVMPSDNAQLLLFIDQFEEIFTLVESEEQRQQFLDSVLEAITDERSRIKIVITIRADFYDRPLLYSKFGDLIRRRTELVLPLTSEELEDAIRTPAARVGVTLEAGLVNAIINDVNEQPGALPMLQYALTELFERREGRSMTLAAYQEIGGTSGALAKRAEEIFESFDEDAQAFTQQLFLRLVTLGEGTEDTRRRVMQSELRSLGKTHVVQQVIDTYGKYRLLTFDHDQQTRAATVEIAHEALIRQWERMTEWLDENREALRLQRRLNAATHDWLHSEKDPSFLARGARLQQIENWSNDSDIALNTNEAEYLRASIQAREEQLEVERLRQAREEELEQKSRNRLRALAAVMAVAAVVAGLLAVIAFNESTEASDARQAALDALQVAERNEDDALSAREDAVRSAAEAQSLALAANARNAQSENNPQLALALALAARETYTPPLAEIRRMLASATYAPGPLFRFYEHDEAVIAVKFSTDGQRIVSASLDGTIRIWEATGGELIQTIDLGDLQITDVDISSDNVFVVAGVGDGTVRMWDVASGDLIQSLEGHTDMVTTVAISPDDRYILSGSVDQTLRLWDAQTGVSLQTYRGHTGAILKVVFAPDGMTFVSAAGDEKIVDNPNDVSDRKLRLWDRESGETVRVMRPDSGLPRAIDYDGQRVAVGLWDSASGGTVRLYNARTGIEMNRFQAQTSIITGIAFSPDERYVASVSWDKTLRIFDIDAERQVQLFTGFEDRLLDMDYSPNGEYLLVASGNVGNNPFADTDQSTDTSVWVWDRVKRDEMQTLRDHDDWLWAIDVSPDGRYVATAGGPLRLPALEQGQTFDRVDTAIRIWDMATGNVIQTLEGHTNTVDSVQFHPDGTRLLSASWDGLIIMWDIDTGERLQLYREHKGRVYDVVFNADGSQFLSAGEDTHADDDRDDNVAYLWDTGTGDILQTFAGHEGGVLSVAFHPNENVIGTASKDRTIRLWRMEDGQHLFTFEGHSARVNEIIFTPDLRGIISSSNDDTVRMWDIRSGEEVREFLGHNGNTLGLALTEDGQILMTTSEDGTVRAWEVSSGKVLHSFDKHTDWVQEVVIAPDETWAISAAQDRTAQVWRFLRGVDAMAEFARNTRFVRDITCSERTLYRLEPCAFTE